MNDRSNLHRVGRAFLFAAALIGVAQLGACRNTNPSTVVNDLLEGIQPEDPSDVARDAFNVYDADKRRRAINKLSTADWGGEPPYLKTYRLLLDDPDATVRAATVAALGRHGTVNDVPRLTARLGADPAKIVRWEAARALQRIHDERAIDPLITALGEDEDMDVRMAAALALGQYPRRRVFDALVGALNDDDFGVAHAAQQSLATLTGEDFGDRSEPWWQWAKGNEAIFAGQQTYYYPAYKSRGFFAGRLAFWKEREGVAMKRPRSGEDLAPIPEAEAGEPAAGLPSEPEQPAPTPEPSAAPEPDEPSPEPAASPEPGPTGEQPAAPTAEPRERPAGEPDEGEGADEADEVEDAEPDRREPPQPRQPKPGDHPLGASG